MLNIIRPSYSESMHGILSQPRPRRRNEYEHSGVQYDAFSMMYSSCLLLLNLRRKGLKPNTSVKSMNHPLFISFNWKKEGEKKTVLRRWDVWSFFYYDQMKKKKHKGLSLYPPTSLCGFGRTGLEEKPDPERAEIRAGHPTPQRGPTVLGNALLLSLSYSLQCPTLSLSLSLTSLPCPSPCLTFSLLSPPPTPPPPPPQPPIFTILPSAPAPSSPDTRHGTASRVSPFSSTASLPWWCCSAVVLTAHSFPCFPHSDLCSALGPQRNGSLPCLLIFCCVCMRQRECVGECKQWYHIQLNMPNDD